MTSKLVNRLNKVNQDGFLTSHTTEIVLSLSDEDAYNFVGDYVPLNPMLDTTKPVTYGAQTEEEWHFEHKMRQHHAMMTSFGVIKRVFDEYSALTGREYKFLETYKTEDADEIIICMGSVFGTTKLTVDAMRESGKKVGVMALRLFRPFPREEIAEVIKNTKAVAVLDRSSPCGTTGALYNEVVTAMFENGINIPVLNYIYGLGGRDTTVVHLTKVYQDLEACKDSGKRVKPIMQTINLRGPELSFY
jgi:pyruvate ferredoxin oxidoreductase alpha subunit